MAATRWISATVLLTLLSVVCGCGLTGSSEPKPKITPTDLGRYYLTVRVVDYDRQTPVSGVTVQVKTSTCSPGTDRSLNASRGEKVEPSASQTTGPQGTVRFAVNVDRNLPASLEILVSALFAPEVVEGYQNNPSIQPCCNSCWNPVEQGDCEFTIVKPALRIVASLAEQTVTPRESVHVTASISNLAPYPADYSLLLNQPIPTSQPPSQGRLESGMSTRLSWELSPPELGWTFGAQTVAVHCYQIDEGEKWLNMVSAKLSFSVPSSQ